MKIKKPNKRGIALESAIIFMVTIFSLAVLIMTITLTTSYRLKANDTLLGIRLEIDQMGEQMIEGNEAALNEAGYSSQKNENTYVLTKNGKEVLIVETLNGEVIKWIYQ